MNSVQSFVSIAVAGVQLSVLPAATGLTTSTSNIVSTASASVSFKFYGGSNYRLFLTYTSTITGTAYIYTLQLRLTDVLFFQVTDISINQSIR